MNILLWVFLSSIAISLVLTPIIRWLAINLRFFYHPHQDSVNRKPVPLLGGLSLYLAVLIPILWVDQLDANTTGILIGTTLVFLLGLADDIRHISSRMQLVGIFLAASIVVGYGVKIQFFSNPFGPDMLLLQALSVPITMIWIAALTSSVKVMDGLDGLASGICAISALALFAVAWDNSAVYYSPAAILMLALAGACLGFLPYNFHPAKIFMGEAGVMFLGFALASISIEGLFKRSFLIAISIPLLALGLPLFNTLFAILRRGLKRKDVLSADRDHVHDILLKRGVSHRQAVLTLYLISVFLGIIAFLMSKVSALIAFLIWIVLVVILFLGAWRIGLIGERYRPKD
ncbi:MAG: MraY family glycosyltransferase [Coprothermobacterota bacterium]|nr:MraY family glycosyltransferase [Coprothermobacterota bacterium]